MVVEFGFGTICTDHLQGTEISVSEYFLGVSEAFESRIFL